MNRLIYIAGGLFILIILTGYWLSHSGKPLNGFIFTLHKLISLSAAIYLGINLVRMDQAAPLPRLAVSASIAALLFFILLAATGGVLSGVKDAPVIVRRIHQIVPYLTVLSTGLALYLV